MSLAHWYGRRDGSALDRRVRDRQCTAPTDQILDGAGRPTRMTASDHDTVQVLLLDQADRSRLVFVRDPPGGEDLHVALNREQVRPDHPLVHAPGCDRWDHAVVGDVHPRQHLVNRDRGRETRRRRVALRAQAQACDGRHAPGRSVGRHCRYRYTFGAS